MLYVGLAAKKKGGLNTSNLQSIGSLDAEDFSTARGGCMGTAGNLAFAFLYVALADSSGGQLAGRRCRIEILNVMFVAGDLLG